MAKNSGPAFFLICALLPSMLNAAPDGRVDALMKKLSLQEKVGQLFIIAADTTDAAQDESFIRQGKLGGVLLRWDMFTGAQAKDFVARLRSWTDTTPAKVPLLIAADYESGPLFTQRRYGATLFPANMALGAAQSAALAEQAAYVNGRELRELGINVDFAPDTDVNSNPLNPVIGIRSFGQDPALVSELGAAAIRGYLRAGIIPTAKHFPGHGNASTDSHHALPVISESLSVWKKTDLPPFSAAIAAGVPMIMSAHILVPALDPKNPATLSAAAITGVLRGELGFKGVIVTDSLDMGAITNTYGVPAAALRAFSAGCDLLLIGKGNLPQSYDKLLAAVQSGAISTQRLDDSVRRILEIKDRAGLLGGHRKNLRGLARVGTKANQALAETIAEKTITLVSNENSLLPLKIAPDKNLVVLMARDELDAPDMAAFRRALLARHGKTSFFEFSPLIEEKTADDLAAKSARADVIIFGAYRRGGADDSGQVLLYHRLRELKKPIVIISLMSPYDLADFPGANARLCIYGITTASLKALAKVIFGAARPGGKLPVDIPGLFKIGAGLTKF